MRAKQKKKYTNSPLERDHRVSVRACVCVSVSAISSEKFRAPIYTTRSNSRSTNSSASFAHANLTICIHVGTPIDRELSIMTGRAAAAFDCSSQSMTREV